MISDLYFSNEQFVGFQNMNLIAAILFIKDSRTGSGVSRGAPLDVPEIVWKGRIYGSESQTAYYSAINRSPQALLKSVWTFFKLLLGKEL